MPLTAEIHLGLASREEVSGRCRMEVTLRAHCVSQILTRYHESGYFLDELRTSNGSLDACYSALIRVRINILEHSVPDLFF